MIAKKLGHDDVGKPDFLGRFDAGTKSLDDAQLFDLSSHTLAREALDFALSMEGEGYNIFVLGEDRSGRMDATRGYITAHVSDKAPSDDWVYLNNFRRTHKPRPVRLPAGKGRAFRDDMAELLPALTDALRKAFTSDAMAIASARHRRRPRRKWTRPMAICAVSRVATDWTSGQGPRAFPW